MHGCTLPRKLEETRIVRCETSQFTYVRLHDLRFSVCETLQFARETSQFSPVRLGVRLPSSLVRLPSSLVRQ